MRVLGGVPWWLSVRNTPAVQETWVRSLGREDPLEEDTATHSSILAWRIPWREEPGGLQSMGLQRVGYDLATKQQQPVILDSLVFCFGSVSLVFLELFLQWSLVAYWALTDLGSSSFSVLSLPFHTVHGVLNTRILKWFAIPFSTGPCFVRTLHHLGWPYTAWLIVSLS